MFKRNASPAPIIAFVLVFEFDGDRAPLHIEHAKQTTNRALHVGMTFRISEIGSPFLMPGDQCFDDVAFQPSKVRFQAALRHYPSSPFIRLSAVRANSM